MSETQTKYETDAGPTPGPWEVITYDRVGHGGKDYTVDMEGWDCRVADIKHSGAIGESNARLIAAAGTAAQKAKLLGYHPVDAIRSMPGLIVALQEIADGHEEPQTVARHALKSVEGVEDE